MPLDKTKLGTRYTCFSCGTKFYDLNRPKPTCPECGADQNDAPRHDPKDILSRGRRVAPVEDKPMPEKDDAEDDDGLFDSPDDDEVVPADEDDDE